MVSQLVSKNRELDKMYQDLDDMTKSLSETKQQLRDRTTECQALKYDLAKMEERHEERSSSALLDTISKLRREKDELNLIVEELRQELEGNNHQNEMDGIDRRLKQDIMIIENQMTEHRVQLENERLCKNDIDELEEQLTRMEQDVKQKEARIKELEDELVCVTERLNEAREHYEDDLRDLEQQVIEIEQEIRKRDVQIASLEGHLEAQADATQRERNIHAEEIKDLEDKIHNLGDMLREKDTMLSNMHIQYQQQMVTEEDYEHDLAAVKKVGVCYNDMMMI